MRKVQVRILALALVAIAATGTRIAADETCGRLASVQNEVSTRAADAESWSPATRNADLAPGDRVRTGEASRAAILYSDQTLHRVNEKSEVEIRAPGANEPGVLRVLSGQHYFSSRKPKDYGRVETPTVTAAIRGTEFVVDVGADGTTTITMIEGVVDASNEWGALSVTAGEAAFVRPGEAPVRRVNVRPRDAVTWSLYYPPLGSGSGDADLDRAQSLLAGGQVARAAPIVERALERDGRNPLALALSSVIDLVADRRDDARGKALRAVEADGDSAAAALALSFVHQADFDIEAARESAERATRLDPDNPETHARVAELRMAEGDVRGAREAAEKAVRRDPDSARALSVRGFVELAEFRTDDAVATFRRAVAADGAFPLARLGLGIALLRTDLAAGREELQTAVILDPENSLLRSYLSKAYFEERRADAASKELEAAKQLDPQDPTPHLYDALLKRTYNRPVEALAELQRAIELNDRRAVYRSRLLLDEDLAVRSADLAGIYNELGFDRLGLVTARSSADRDQSNFSSHLFLAGTYRNLPGYAPAFLSETLQARIYQPVSVNAVRPDVVNESVSFNEYTSLFNRPRLRGFAGLRYGRTDDGLDEYFDPGDLCLDPTGAVGECLDLLSVDGSSASGADLTLTFNRDRYAAAISYETFDDDGFRVNNDSSNDALRAFVVVAPTPRDRFQLNVIDGKRETGDLPLRGFPSLIGLERVETELTNIGLGYHRKLSTAADLAVSLIVSETDQNFAIPLFMQAGSANIDGDQLEAQYVHRLKRTTWTAGAGRYAGEQTVTSANVGFPVTTLRQDDEFSNAYVYAGLQATDRLQWSAGASYEDLLAPVGLLPPRDSNLLISDLTFEESRISPKLGLSYRLAADTVLRASAYQRLTPAIGRLQTLEPTQVSGFNQFFDDPAGTTSTNYGLGLDQQFGKRVFAGLSLLRRDLEIPEPYCATPDPNAGCSFQAATTVVERDSDDWLGNLYVNATVASRLALSLEYAYEQREFDFTQLSNNSLFEDYVETQRLRPQLRYFMPNGFFLAVRGTRYDQTVEQFDDLTDATRMPIDAEFWTADIDVGYRLPKRWGSVTLSVLNATDREFVYYRSSLEQDIVPARTALLSVNFTSP